MRVRSVLLMAATAMCATMQGALASSGPFGVNMGDDPAALGCTAQDEPGYFRCSSAPKHHPDMEWYVAQSYPETGICWFKGIGKDVSTNGHGAPVKEAVDKIAAQVSNTYGASTKLDFLSSGSIWNEPHEWMRSVEQDERYYAYSIEGSGAEDLPNDVSSIYVGAGATSDRSGYVIVEVSYDNYARCEEIENQQGSDSF